MDDYKGVWKFLGHLEIANSKRFASHSCWKGYFILPFLWNFLCSFILKLKEYEFSTWFSFIMDSLGFYTCSSFFHFLIHRLTPALPPTKSFWKTKIPSKVKAFVWTAILNKININDLLQSWTLNKVLSPDVCVMCFQNSKTNNLFLCTLKWWKIWNQLFGLLEESWASPADLGLSSRTNQGFWEEKK